MNNILFVCHKINSQLTKSLPNYIIPIKFSYKIKSHRNIISGVQKIISAALQNKVIHIIIIFNTDSRFIHELLKIKESKNIDIPISALIWKSKNYKINILKKLENILSYSSNYLYSQYVKSHQIDTVLLKKIKYLPWPSFLDDKKVNILKSLPISDYFFSGGDNKRDYLTLIESFINLPYRLIIATNCRFFSGKKCLKSGYITGEVGKTISKFIKLDKIQKGYVTYDSFITEMLLKYNKKSIDNITILYNVSLDKYHELLAKSYAYIHAIKDPITGFSSLSEAIHLSKPIIAINTTSITDSLQHNHNSLLINSSVHEYQQACKLLKNDIDFRNDLAQNMSHISYQRSFSYYNKFILDITNQKI